MTIGAIRNTIENINEITENTASAAEVNLGYLVFKRIAIAKTM